MHDEKLMSEETAELTDAQLDGVAGGYLFKNEQGQWEVIDGSGNVQFTSDYNQAYDWAESHYYNTRVIDWLELRYIRNPALHG